MITWLSAMLEKCQDSLADAKEWLDTEVPVKKRWIVLAGVLFVCTSGLIFVV